MRGRYFLGTGHPLEHLRSALGELRYLFGHGSVAERGIRTSVDNYAGGPVSFLIALNGGGRPIRDVVEMANNGLIEGQIDLFGGSPLAGAGG